MTQTVTLTGLDEMKQQLMALPAEIKKQAILNKAILAGAQKLKAEVQARAPVKTGALRKNIIVVRDRHPERSGATAKYSVMVRKIKISRKVRKLLRRVRNAGAAVRISDSIFYWRFAEFGTSRQPARPFFRPAIAIVEPQLVDLVGTELAKGIDAALRSIGGK